MPMKDGSSWLTQFRLPRKLRCSLIDHPVGSAEQFAKVAQGSVHRISTEQNAAGHLKADSSGTSHITVVDFEDGPALLAEQEPQYLCGSDH